jgi:hypothetical protein
MFDKSLSLAFPNRVSSKMALRLQKTGKKTQMNSTEAWCGLKTNKKNDRISIISVAQSDA